MPLNKIFSVIKKYRGQEEVIYAVPCYEILKSQLNLTDEQLEIYLEVLTNLQVITFKKENKEIFLTSLGFTTNAIRTIHTHVDHYAQ